MTLILATGTNPGTATWIDASILGGGCTVIPVDGTISGNYECDVLCEGNVSMAGNVEVFGNMIIRGALYNTEGYNLTVRGDCHAQQIDWSKRAPGFQFVVIPQNSSNTFTQPNGILQSDFYPSEYPPNCDGYTVFTGIPGVYREITGSIETEESYDYVRVYDGVGTGGALLYERDGFVGFNFTSAPNQTFTVQFESDGSIEYSGFSLTVDGFYADVTTTQGNLQVDGNLFFTSINFPQYLQTIRQLTVGGNLIGIDRNNSPISANGAVGTFGADIFVTGDLVASSVNLNGGLVDVEAEIPPGPAGRLFVSGNVTLRQYLLAVGGNGQDGSPAGYGGVVNVGGNLIVAEGFINVSGGSGLNSSANSGGAIQVGGTLAADEIYADGGDCESDSENYGAARAGSITVQGNLSCTNLLSLSGGFRQGNITANNTLVSANGGTLRVNGNVSGDDYVLNGGNVFTGDFAPQEAGAGGEVDVLGNFIINDDLEFRGGSCSFGQAGNGGSVDIQGNLVCDDFEGYGGSCLNGSGGTGGSGNVEGHARIGDLNMAGGSAINGFGKPGGSLIVDGHLQIAFSLNMNGGYCNSTNEQHFAGSGGDLRAGSFVCSDDEGSATLDGGYREGATTVINLGAAQANGGQLIVDGPTSISTVSLNGGYVNTSEPNASGGSGGYMVINGPLTVGGALYLNGGDSVGNSGGAGGTLVVSGSASADRFEAVGGNSNTGTSTNGTNGAGGSMTFQDGLSSLFVLLKDGAGTNPAAALGVVNLFLNNACTIGVLDQADRSNSYIRWGSRGPAIVKINSLPTKTTLNDPGGTPTASQAANVATDLYSSSATNWLSIPGTVL